MILKVTNNNKMLKVKNKVLLLLLWIVGGVLFFHGKIVSCFVTVTTTTTFIQKQGTAIMSSHNSPSNENEIIQSPSYLGRREMIKNTSVFLSSISALSITTSSQSAAVAEVGTIPEFADTNAILQGITVNVADLSQQEAMINFLINAFDCKVLRKRIRGTVEETVSRRRG
jgi:hypothetical protein